MSPLVSVVIPTAGRPQFVGRAVDSALAGMAAGEIEVIVVPNGPDESWVDALSRYHTCPSVKVLPVSQPNANVARNYGMNSATGKYLRFLDDDDFIYPDGARAQYEALERSGADVCSGGLHNVDPDGRVFQRLYQPDTDDFAAAVLCPQRRGIPVMHVFRRAFLDGLQWRDSQPFLQDIQWLFDVCLREPHWVKINEPSGIWQHHRGNRVSKLATIHLKQKDMARMILETVAALETSGRMTPERRRAAGAGLWNCIHLAFHLNPAYWLPFARRIMKSYPDARPDIGLYRIAAGRIVNPIAVETLMLPKRWLNYLVRAAGNRLGLRDQW
jgi:glycosyltransferase involved in cell wall biosynthesis